MTVTDDQAEADAIAQAEAAADRRVKSLEATFDQWVNDCVHNSPASRDTAGFNHLHATALPELRRRLLKGLAQ
jgi:hypothetical protein